MRYAGRMKGRGVLNNDQYAGDEHNAWKIKTTKNFRGIRLQSAALSIRYLIDKNDEATMMVLR